MPVCRQRLHQRLTGVHLFHRVRVTLPRFFMHDCRFLNSYRGHIEIREDLGGILNSPGTMPGPLHPNIRSK